MGILVSSTCYYYCIYPHHCELVNFLRLRDVYIEEKEHACIINIYIRSRVCIIVMNLIGEHFDLLQNGISGSTSLSSSGERHDAETAHVLTASHYRAVTEERWETKGRE